MHNTTFHIIRTACVMALAGSAALAHAELSAATYNAAKDQLKATYKTERDTCDAMNGNTKDICVETAKGAEKVALAHLQMQRTGSAKDKTDFAQARLSARYEVAKEKCDDQTGNAKSVCNQQAKAEHDKTRAEVKMNKEVREARNEADETRMKADYDLASTRCDALTGDGKSACTAAAKARYGM